MANKDLPYGFRPATHLNGGPWNGQTMRCFISASDTAASYIGDPVLMTGDSCHRGCCPQVVLATTGVTAIIMGVTSSFEQHQDAWCGNQLSVAATSAPLVHRLASTERFANVVIDPDVVYAVQGDSTNVITALNVGRNVELILTANTNSAALGLSCAEILGGASAVTTITEQLWLMGKVDRPDNDISVVNADWYVFLNTSSFGRNSGAAGYVTGI